jgi:hypothetical protein
MQEHDAGFNLWIICVYIPESVPANLTALATLRSGALAGHQPGLYDFFFIIVGALYSQILFEV